MHTPGYTQAVLYSHTHTHSSSRQPEGLSLQRSFHLTSMQRENRQEGRARMNKTAGNMYQFMTRLCALWQRVRAFICCCCCSLYSHCIDDIMAEQSQKIIQLLTWNWGGVKMLKRSHRVGRLQPVTHKSPEPSSVALCPVRQLSSIQPHTTSDPV